MIKNLFALLGVSYAIKTIYKAGEMVGEVKGSLRAVKEIRKEFKAEKKKIWETEARA